MSVNDPAGWACGRSGPINDPAEGACGRSPSGRGCSASGRIQTESGPNEESLAWVSAIPLLRVTKLRSLYSAAMKTLFVSL